jgi:hypothetical protein
MSTTLHRPLPPAALALGLTGLIPFIGIGIAAVTTADPGRAQTWLLALIGYGAVVLAFLGGVHWGFVLHPAATEGRTPEERQESTRLGLAVLPSLIGWAAVVTPAFALPAVGLAILIAGYLATVVTEGQLRRRGLVPSGYMALRWALSAVVLVVLVTVLALRLIGARIIF